MLKRRDARIHIASLLFEYEFDREKTAEEILALARDCRELPDDEFVNSVFTGCIENITDIDNKIAEAAEGWKFDRISRIAVAVMRLAVYETLYMSLTPNIAINEALEIAKLYDDEAGKFINGILHKISHADNGDENV
jgi:N utilization substance protein B